MKYLLLTGATGLVGRYLLRDLLQRGHAVAVVVRSDGEQTAAERIEEIMRMWDQRGEVTLPRPICLEGDVTAPALGLNDEGKAWVAEHCDTMIHNAASLTFRGADRAGEPWRTNLDGTRYVIEFCRDVGIRKFHYVSTAYVCGNREGVILEDELDAGQEFRNEYEQSKFLAEQLVRSSDCLDTPTVYRPAVIVGDSVTGYTNTYHGLLHHLKFMAVLFKNMEPGPDGRRHVPLRLNMTGDEQRNMVTVDWVSAVMVRLYETQAAHGGTYHLSPTHPMTPRDLITAVESYFHVYGAEFVGPLAASERNDAEQKADESLDLYESYATTDPTFDISNMLRFAGDIVCPRVDEALIHRFIDFGDADKWGKRPRKKPRPV
ncbi:MAG TPA: SDR family oxidoreductase [Schlesneria sp.]|jgi:thioester reductase-like protein